jgi:maltooligosyltrehalose trehalohydrolase
MAIGLTNRRLPVGAEIVPEGGASFRVWTPRRHRVDIVFEETPQVPIPLEPEGNGYFSGLIEGAGAGMRYRFCLDGSRPLPDPASRFQPDGPRGPSELIDPSIFQWSDHAWPGVEGSGQVLYEMHVGTFTQEGTWQSAAQRLPDLADLGVTVIEMMPVAEFAGRFGWGYDGVDLFAPTKLYGRPDDLRRFVDRAHSLGIGVILDVVYNHFGPEGAVHCEFSSDYVTARYANEWGDAINFDGENSDPVREFFLTNAGYWIDEFHFDGLRVDATQQFFDTSPESILTAITRRVRQASAGRAIFLVGESEPQDTRLLRPIDQGGAGFHALWNDDFHHVAMIAATRRREAYYADYLGTAQEFVSLAKHGFLYQGQFNTRQRKRRGSAAWGVNSESFVLYLQNHDQIANSLRGQRLHQLTSPGLYRALSAFQLLAPGTPMLFQGQEFAASAPFLYFADHGEPLARRTAQSRARFLEQFPSLALAETKAIMQPPARVETFLACKLNHAERDRPGHTESLAMHRDLLRLRREDPVLSERRRGGVDGAVLGPDALVLRYFGAEQEDRLLFLNLGVDLHLDPAPEPLLAPPAGMRWDLLWSSEDPRYGGGGTPALEREDNWWIPGQAAVAMAARAVSEGEHG